MTIKNQKLFLMGRKDAINADKPACDNADYIAGYERGIEYLGQRVAKERARTAKLQGDAITVTYKDKPLFYQVIGRATRVES